MFSELPLVERVMRTSSFRPTASICCENNLSKPKSFPIAVIVATSVVSASARRGRRSCLKRPRHSLPNGYSQRLIHPVAPQRKSVPSRFTRSNRTPRSLRISWICCSSPASASRCSPRSCRANASISCIIVKNLLQPRDGRRYISVVGPIFQNLLPDRLGIGAFPLGEIQREQTVKELRPVGAQLDPLLV